MVLVDQGFQIVQILQRDLGVLVFHQIQDFLGFQWIPSFLDCRELHLFQGPQNFL